MSADPDRWCLYCFDRAVYRPFIEMWVHEKSRVVKCSYPSWKSGPPTDLKLAPEGTIGIRRGSFGRR